MMVKFRDGHFSCIGRTLGSLFLIASIAIDASGGLTPALCRPVAIQNRPMAQMTPAQALAERLVVSDPLSDPSARPPN